ncbi:DHS-like NAD/FAD-binding domain-containing protein [Armillaria nabsnona]|nr:DHS-like NAD/FAD-binding domain-containing protein [Armillaria nabsnona]
MKEVETTNAAPKAPTTFRVLKGNDIKAVAEYMKSKDCLNIIVMLGAGVNASVGIPVYRCPETESSLMQGYSSSDTLKKIIQTVYTLAQAIYPGKYRPTFTHSFIRLIASRRLLHKCFTRNIDTHEWRTGVPNYKEHIRNKEVARCELCGGLVKPGIVLSSRQPTDEFMRAIPSIGMADLLIIVPLKAFFSIILSIPIAASSRNIFVPDRLNSDAVIQCTPVGSGHAIRTPRRGIVYPSSPVNPESAKSRSQCDMSSLVSALVCKKTDTVGSLEPSIMSTPGTSAYSIATCDSDEGDERGRSTDQAESTLDLRCTATVI